MTSTSQNHRAAAETPKPGPQPKVALPRSVGVKRLAELLGVSGIEVIKVLMKKGSLVTINQTVDYETASGVASALGFEATAEVVTPIQAAGLKAKALHAAEAEASGLKLRPPVVTVMGHVDHGKTSLLDAIRKTKVAAGEAGSITQHIGAYQVEVKGQGITFLDTPGHEAFTAMRARGAQVTDIAVLVVAADDGIMPQTVEAIDHAKAAGVPIIVALNKIDKPEADPDRVKRQLGDQGLVIEEWGGDVICVPTSAKTGQGIDTLLENILVVAEVAELKANPNRRGEGSVIEARMDSNRGPVATLLVQTGSLKVGDVVVVGDKWGKIKAMFNDRSKPLRKAEPATPVEVLGLNSIPAAGDTFAVMVDEKAARTLVKRRLSEKGAIATGPSLDELFSQIRAGQVKELNIILKADVQGSLEPIRTSLEKLPVDSVRVRVIHSGTGNITETDVFLARASKGIIIGFNNQVEPGAKRVADLEGVDIHIYSVIYKLLEDVEKSLKGMREPVFVDVVEGHAEVRATFSVKKLGNVAGCYITDGRVSRGSLARVIRKGVVVHQGAVSSLRHFKDDVKEMAAGFECGLGVEGFSAFETGDIIETYRRERE
ncbi:MAG: translation initiation factor IF-2 [Chloroflexi bacterium]|nr:translation initiation factor IF-2 [Chloroflexota bacterium]